MDNSVKKHLSGALREHMLRMATIIEKYTPKVFRTSDRRMFKEHDKIKSHEDCFNMNITPPDTLRLDKNTLEKINDKRKFNETLAEYYNGLAEISGKENLKEKADRVKDCCAIWSFDFYKLAAVKDLKHVSRCKDKFCLICQEKLSEQRVRRFKPILDKFVAEGRGAYHMVFTQKNVRAWELIETIDLLFKSFWSVTRYLTGKPKIKGLDFSRVLYMGALRSLEITINPDDETYHVHIHSIMITKKPIVLDKYIENVFSKSRKNGFRYFSEFEIYLQKIWYLLINRKKVTLANIDEIDLGYSCTCDLIEDEKFHEVFKYAVKLDNASEVLTYTRFLNLYNALKNRRVIQGYGCMFGLELDDELSEEEEQREDLYYILIAALQLLEKPVGDTIIFANLLYELMETSNYIYISKNNDYTLQNFNVEEFTEKAIKIIEEQEAANG